MTHNGASSPLRDATTTSSLIVRRPGLLTLNALVAPSVLIPCTQYFALEGPLILMTTWRRVRAGPNPMPDVDGSS